MQGTVHGGAQAINEYSQKAAADSIKRAESLLHRGYSDSIGAIAWNMLGCLHGASRIPARWLEPMEMRELITEVAHDLATAPDWKVGGFCTTETEKVYITCTA